MPKFRFSATIGCSAYTEVEAETEAEAREIAEEREAQVSLGHDGYEPDELWIVSEADGSPRDIHLT